MLPASMPTEVCLILVYRQVRSVVAARNTTRFPTEHAEHDGYWNTPTAASSLEALSEVTSRTNDTLFNHSSWREEGIFSEWLIDVFINIVEYVVYLRPDSSRSRKHSIPLHCRGKNRLSLHTYYFLFKLYSSVIYVNYFFLIN